MFRRLPSDPHRPDEHSLTARCHRRVPDNASILFVDANVGWHRPTGKASINSRTNERRTDEGKLAAGLAAAGR